MKLHPNIMNAASNLMGICFLIITGLSLTKSNDRSIADEVAWFAAICMLASVGLSYLAIRRDDSDCWQAAWADRIFLVGLLAMMGATAVIGFALK